MHIPQPFSSPFLHTNITKLSSQHYGELIAHFQNAERALTYHLHNTLPRGSTITIIHQGPLLARILPDIIKEKGITLTKNPTRADYCLVEPDGLTDNGCLLPPHTTLADQHAPLIAIASILQWHNMTPSTHDYAPVDYILTELGKHTPEHFKQELTSYASWTSSLLSSS